MNTVKNFILPPLVLFLICAGITMALAATNLLTKDKISKVETGIELKAMEEVIHAESFTPQNLSYNGMDIPYYKALNGKKTAGYVFVTEGKGYGGSIKVMTAVDTDGSIISMAVLSAGGETPGLGTNALNPEWWKQFQGLSEGAAVKKDGGKVDALTGATITSRAVANAVNTALDYFNAVEVE